MSSDVADFESALRRGDLASAVELYRGPFLEGFYLGDAPEFEQWLDGERGRLARSYAGALERLARSADAAHDHAAAIKWWRKLTEAEPVSGKNATGLITALMNAGDHASALQHAEHYEAVVAEELGTSAGPAVAALVADVRAKAKSERVTGKKSGPPPTKSDFPATPVGAETRAIEQPRSPRTAGRWRYIVGSVAILAAIAAAAFVRESARSTPAPPVEGSIAVLPFSNVTANKEDDPLVDGLSEELIGALSRISDLRVIGRTSSFAFRNSNAGARRIADSLGVSNILEGSVQRSGSRLRVQVRLVDPRDGSTRWSEIYDRDVKDIFAVQSEIADAVARELDLRLGEQTLARIKRGSTRNVAAYELYLRGNDQMLFRSDSGARNALEYLSEAVALDTGYAAAYAGIARVQKRIGFGNDTELSRPERLARAEQAALKAVALDDSSADAHAALSMVRRDQYAMGKAETELKRAVALDPTRTRFREELVQLYVMTERPTEALLEGHRAVELDPLSPTANAELAHALLANGRCDEALAQLDRLKSLRPPLNRAGAIAAECYGQRGMWPEAIAEIQRIAPNGGPRGQAMLGYMLGRGGRTAEARQVLDSLLERSRRTNGGAFDVAIVYAGLGDKDQAFAWLNKAVDDRSLGFEWMYTIVNGLRPDPRFEKLQHRIGLNGSAN